MDVIRDITAETFKIVQYMNCEFNKSTCVT